jgi:uncharacterized small protein (DUF1192 family)
MEADLQTEIERLRAEVESYRQRELADLKSALAVAREDAAHYRSEAQRNADVAKLIVADYEKKVGMLQAQLEALKPSVTPNGRRPLINRT